MILPVIHIIFAHKMCVFFYVKKKERKDRS